MNKLQNIKGKKHKERISELEIEVSLLRQKLEMIGKICGLDDLARVQVIKDKTRPMVEDRTKYCSYCLKERIAGDGSNWFFKYEKLHCETCFKNNLPNDWELWNKVEKAEKKEEKKEDSFAEHLKR